MVRVNKKGWSKVRSNKVNKKVGVKLDQLK